jgi:uncharacterized membrane protein YgdD (TMEM256/DUF423 family)
MYKPALIIGIIGAALAVILGAFGAHGLKELVTPEQLVTYEKGVTYQMYHSLALLAVAIMHNQYPFKPIRVATVLFGLGILLFSGSLYVLVALQHAGASTGPVGPITPIGGLCFILGWFALLLGILKKKD